VRSARARAYTLATRLLIGTERGSGCNPIPRLQPSVPRHVLLKTLSEIAALSYVNIGVNAVLTVVVIASALNNPPDTPPSTTFAVRPSPPLR
jgi:hypothetical protein